MIVTKQTPLNTITDGEPIMINKEVSLDRKLLELLFQKFPHSKITISTLSTPTYAMNESDALYDEKELQILVENADLADRYNKELTFDDEYTISDAIIASRTLNGRANYINNFKINGQPLSQLEKFMLAYSMVINKAYNADTNPDKSRNIISTLTGDKIVCAGFANELCALCKKIGVPCAYRISAILDAEKPGNHATCIVNIADEKYGVKGVFVADPTDDAKSKETITNPMFFFKFKNFLLTHDEYQFVHPNNLLDKALINDLPGSKDMVNVHIQHINDLYPQIDPPKSIDNTWLNQDTHELDIKGIINQLKTRISTTLPQTTKQTPTNFNNVNIDLIEDILGRYLAYTLTNEPLTDIPPLVENRFKELSKTISKEEILPLLLSHCDLISEYSIVEMYDEYLEGDKKSNRYTDYTKRLISDISTTQHISEQTLRKLFKTIISNFFVKGLSTKDQNEFINQLVQARSEYISQIANQPS